MKEIIANPKKIILTSTILGIVVFLSLYIFLLSGKEQTISNGVSIFASIFTLIGLLFTYLQVLNLKSTSTELKRALNSHIGAFNSINLLSTLSSAILRVDNLNETLGTDLKLSLYKMKDLKLLLLEIKHTELVGEEFIKDEFQFYFENFTNDIKNLDKHLTKATGLNINKIQSNLEDLTSIIKQKEIHLKSKIQRTI